MSLHFKTRPALITRKGSQHSPDPVLRLSVVFHPDLGRIGSFYDLAPWPEESSGPLGRRMAVGRAQPIFSDGSPLADPHVSRTAFELQRTGVGKNSTLRITAGSRDTCWIGTAEAAQLVVDVDQLRDGVPLRLGHGVVIFLRLVDVQQYPRQSHPAAQMVVGCSPEMENLRAHLMAVAATDLPVLVLGESGSGKEVAAQVIHAASHRGSQPLITVNTAAFNESLSGAELFGNTRSAFTGAAARQGYFEQADGGILFLDEIADASDTVQVQLLRALEQGEIQVLGGGIKRVDVRVIAATDGAVHDAGGFRHALLTRLAGHTISIPPLRSRREDIGPQGLHFLRALDESRLAAPLVMPIEASSDDPQVAAHWGRFFFDGLSQPWPGNSRDLRNAVVKAASGDPATAPLLDRAVLDRSASPEAGGPNEGVVSDDLLEQVHEANDFEVAATSRELGMSRQMLYRRIKHHDNIWLIDDLSDQQVLTALEVGGALGDVARRLRVSEASLRTRMRTLKVG